MTNIVADGRQSVLHGFHAVTICDAQVVQSLLQQVRVSTNALASLLSLAPLQQFICNKGLVLLHSFNCEPKRWVLVSNQLLKPAVPAFTYVIRTLLIGQSLRVHVPRVDREYTSTAVNKHWNKLQRLTKKGNRHAGQLFGGQLPSTSTSVV